MTRFARGPVPTARMVGSSIAAPSAAPWITDFLNAAYFARGDDEREVADLRLAQCILVTRWARGSPRRLGIRDLRAFHRAFGGARARRRQRLDGASLLAGGAALLGDWFPDAVADRRRRAHGIAFPTIGERQAYAPELRLRDGALGPLAAPAHPPEKCVWATYPPVVLPDPERALGLLRSPDRWPDFGSDLGSFTAVRSGGLAGQTFEIDAMLRPLPRLPVLTRAYVTCTEMLAAGAALERRVEEIAAYIDVLPRGASAVALIVLTAHRGHFLGRATSHLLVFEHAGRSFVRDVGCWDPLPWHLKVGYAHGGHDAQQAFWGPQPVEGSLLAQLAIVSASEV